MKYEVLSPLNHDNKLYEVGKQVELTDEAAAPLLACGCVEPQKKEPKKEPKKAD